MRLREPKGNARRERDGGECPMPRGIGLFGAGKEVGMPPTFRAMDGRIRGGPGSPGSFAQRFPSAFVTGGSSGLGRVFVEALAREGVEVWAGSRSAARLQALPPGARAVELDLSDRKEVSEFLSRPPWPEPPALLFNNAGYGRFDRLAEIEEGGLSEQLAAMLEAPALLSRHFLCAGVGQTGRAVVNVSSLAVEYPLPMMHGYNAVKAGLSGWSRSLALEFPGGDGSPFVIDLRPGDYRTDFNQAVRRTDGREGDRFLGPIWEALEKHLQAGAEPQSIWPPVRRALLRGRSRTLRTGTFFQARVAALAARLLPEGLVNRIHRGYYGMDKG